MSRFEASDYLSAKWPVLLKQRAACSPLNQDEIRITLEKLKADALRLMYSALISLADGLRGLDQGYYSWSGIKAYYAAFYVLRAFLALDGICIFWIEGKAKWVEATPGAVPENPISFNGQQTSGSTHKLVSALFERRYQNNPLLSQEIGGISPLLWMQQNREELNYKNAKFLEPECPPAFKYCAKYGVRKVITEYIEDSSMAFCFDPDHAILAYPIELLKTLRRSYSNDLPLEYEDKIILKKYFSDQKGRLVAFSRIVD